MKLLYYLAAVIFAALVITLNQAQADEVIKVKEINFEPQAEIVRLKITTSQPVKYEVKNLTDPPRIYINLFDSQIHPAKREIEVSCGVIQRIRVSQFQVEPDIVRVVVDLEKPTDYKILDTGEENEIVFEIKRGEEPPLDVTKAEFSVLSEKNCETKVITSRLANYSAFVLFNPVRLVVDIEDAVLKIRPPEVEVTHPLISKIRMSQFQRIPEEIVRLVFDLTKACAYNIKPLKGSTGILVHIREPELMSGVVVIDPGHGGMDKGATGLDGLEEKEVNLDIASRLAELLESSKVIMTRTEDKYVGLSERVEMAERNNADMFISIHCNSTAVADSKSGIETYYYSSEALPLAEAIHRAIVGSLGLKDGGIKQRRFYVLRNVSIPAVLVECAYLSDTAENKLLGEPEFRQKIAETIAAGIRSCVKREKG